MIKRYAVWFMLIAFSAAILAGVYHWRTQSARNAGEILEISGTEGGLVVHVNCGNGKLTAALRADDRFLVQGISRSWESVENARKHIQGKGLYGEVSVVHWSAPPLPYSDQLVNLLVVGKGEVPAQEEIDRVLAPGGVALIRRDGKWNGLEKPWPASIDEWTHYAHGPDGNHVAQDSEVGPPGHIRWLAGPNWGRDHRYGNKTAMVSAQGRLFYVENDVPSSIEYLPDRPHLVARDAFNGVLLWKKPIWPRSPKDMMAVDPDPEKFEHFEPVFPMELKMVAVGDRLFMAFGRNGEIQVLDAATGRILHTLDDTGNTEEILLSDGILLAVGAGQGEEMKDMDYTKAERIYNASYKKEREKILRALDPVSGRVIWEMDTRDSGGPEVSPVIRDGHVYCIIGGKLEKTDLFRGERVWSADLTGHAGRSRLNSLVFSSGPTVRDRLIATGEVILLAAYAGGPGTGSDDMFVSSFSVETGEHLWSRPCKTPKYAGTSAYVVGDRVWVHEKYPEEEKKVPNRPSNQLFPVTALDIHSGKELIRYNAEKIFDVDHHHRCYGNRATSRFLLTGRRGVEFTDFNTGEIWLNHWVRGKCRFGVLPCNGLLYSLPHSCSCYPYSMITGYTALAHQEKAAVSGDDFTGGPDRLEQGPGYTKGINGFTGQDGATQEESRWVTYRYDGTRSGSTPEAVPPEMIGEVCWKTFLEGVACGLTADGERIYTCTPETHQVHALDRKNGKVRWRFTAGSRVDSPPTIYGDLVLFGSGDGYVYCLRAETGELVWRFRAAPADRMMIDHDRLESAWPVHGAVLVREGRLYVVAGRTSLLDGGLALFVLDPVTGAILAQNRIHDTYAEAEAVMTGNRGHSYTENNIGVWNDILESDVDGVCLRQLYLDDQMVPAGRSEGKLISISGMLQPNWFSRIGTYFGVPAKTSRGQRGTYDYLDSPRQGSYIIFDEKLSYSVRPNPNMGKFWTSFVPGKEGYRIFADENESKQNQWHIAVPIRVQAMVASAGETLYMAGPPDTIDEEDPWGAIDGRKGGLMWAVSARDGEKLAEYRLDSPPVFDGMIATGGRLYLSSMDGSIVCLGK